MVTKTIPMPAVAKTIPMPALTEPTPAFTLFQMPALPRFVTEPMPCMPVGGTQS